MKISLLHVIILLSSLTARAQEEIPLYEGKIPDSKDPGAAGDVVFNREVDNIVYNVSFPTLSVFLPSPEKSNGTAVIICPGGGYHLLVIEREGREIARAFNRLGAAAFVLKYRLPDDRIMTDKSIGPLQDAQRALQLVRLRAKEWNIDPHMTGIMGFSAGGHLASTAGTHFEMSFIGNEQGINLRPDFMILVYPVISMSDSLVHMGSREYLAGKNPGADKIRFLSNNLHVNDKTPPAFMILAGDDSVVNPENSLIFYNALRANGVPAEIHIYEKGEHGFLKAPPFDEWFGRCCFWMKENGWL